MQRFIHELRRREVFRAAGLYVGISWIIIEVGSVLLPAFDAPAWTIRALIIVALVGFPVTVVLAWVYDVTDKGIVVQAPATDTVVLPFGGRKTDFVVIGVLSVALIISLYINFTDEPDAYVEPDPVSLLIANFDNQTGNPLFEGSVEQALSLGIEGASFITTFPRRQAIAQVESLSLGETLDSEAARLVAVRQNIRMVVSGSIIADGSEYELALEIVDPVSGESLGKSEARADGAADVLAAVNQLAADLRKTLGDESLDLERLEAGENVTAASIEAMKYYTTAQHLARAGQDEQAIDEYRKAIAEDPNMARAYSGWGLSAHKIGRPEDAEQQWQKALSLLDRMTERERYRTLGLYYTVVSVDYAKAIDNYEQLVGKFPADGAGNNNLAILYTFTAQYERALEKSEQLLKIYPDRVLYRGNHAQYALYAGNIETATATATGVTEEDPGFFKSYMVLALAALHGGDIVTAQSYYGRMAETGTRGGSLANIGLADIALFEGRFDDAIAILEGGITIDAEAGISRGRGTKLIALAQAHLGNGDAAAAFAIVDGIDDMRGDGQLVPAAEIYAANGQYSKAFGIAERYRQKLGPTARAYARLIDGMNALHQGEHIIAIETLREAIAHADLWIVRYYLGQAYVAAGYAAAAMTEFDTCIERRSEAAGMFFDDVPTWRYTASLGEWKKKADDNLDEFRTASGPAAN